jgi:hypothetical protein
MVLERFIPADCQTCWQGTLADATRPQAITLDWIVPAAHDAPMASASLPEARERADAAPRSTPASPTRRRIHVLPTRVPALQIVHGPAWNGYIALQLTVTRSSALPAGAVAYAALVERVPAGSEGTAIERQLVRAAVGPLSLAELVREPRVVHLRAVLVPDTDRPERLTSVAWIETAGGRVIAAARALPPGCVKMGSPSTVRSACGHENFGRSPGPKCDVS